MFLIDHHQVRALLPPSVLAGEVAGHAAFFYMAGGFVRKRSRRGRGCWLLENIHFLRIDPDGSHYSTGLSSVNHATA
jgi:hypothetical protein